MRSIRETAYKYEPVKNSHVHTIGCQIEKVLKSLEFSFILQDGQYNKKESISVLF